jgi:hypothetical protein
MIRHVAMFKWNEDVTDAHITATSTALDGLPEVIPEIARYRHGRDMGINPGNFDYAVVADFASPAEFLVYRDHPAHRAVMTGFIVDHISQRSAVQFTCDD